MYVYQIADEVQEFEVSLFDDIIRIIFGQILYLRVKLLEPTFWISTSDLCNFVVPSSYFIDTILEKVSLKRLYPKLYPISHNILGGSIKLHLNEECWMLQVKISNNVICTLKDTNAQTHQIYKDILYHTRRKVIEIISNVHLKIIELKTPYAITEEKEPPFSFSNNNINIKNDNTNDNEEYDKIIKDIKITVNSLDTNI